MRGRTGLTVLVLALGLCGMASQCDEGGEEATSVADFAGHYTGTFTGGDTGTFDVVFSEDGAITGTGVSAEDGSFNLEGTVGDDGDFSALFGTNDIGGEFQGSATLDGAISGTWVNNYWGDEGTFEGSLVE